MPAKVAVSTSKGKASKSAYPPTITPQTLNAAVAAVASSTPQSKEKKDKKRKNKEEEAAVSAVVAPETEKKVSPYEKSLAILCCADRLAEEEEEGVMALTGLKV